MPWARWELWHDDEGVWLGFMYENLCLQLYGPFSTEAAALAEREKRSTAPAQDGEN
jgi:hypothetical protein